MWKENVLHDMTCHSSSKIENEWAKGMHESSDLSDERKIEKYHSLDRHRSRCMLKRVYKYSEDLEKVDPPEGLMWQEQNLQVSEGTSSIDNKNHHSESDKDTRETSTPDNITRLATSGSREPIGEGLSVLDEDHFDINGVTQSEVCNVSAPNDGDGSNVSDLLVWWRSRRLGKPAETCGREQHDRMSRSDQDETLEGSTLERWDAQPGCQQVWCFCCKRSSEVSAYRRKQKGVPRSIAPVSRWHAHVTSLWSASLSFVLEVPVLVRSTRRSGTTCNLVSMHIEHVPSTSQALLRKK